MGRLRRKAGLRAVLFSLLCLGVFGRTAAACQQAGRYLEGADEVCCPGLKPDKGGVALMKGKCVDRSNTIAVVVYGRTRCLPCGDGICESYEDRCNCPADCLPTDQRPKIRYAGSRTHSPSRDFVRPFPFERPAGQSDLYRDYLSDAWETGDASQCQYLPEYQKEYYVGYLHGQPPPTKGYPNREHELDWESAPLSDWKDFCRALAARDRSHCPPRRDFTVPDLYNTCHYYIKAESEKDNTSPAYCYDQIGVSLLFPDRDVRQCLQDWQQYAFGGGSRSFEEILSTSESLHPFTEREIELYRCLEKLDPREQSRCLTDMAVRRKNAALCGLIEEKRVGKLRQSACYQAVSGQDANERP